MLPPEGGTSQIGVLAASQEAWPEVAAWGWNTPPARTAVERRQASCPLLYPPPHAGEDMEGGSGRASCTAGWSKRLPAFRFPFFLSCFDQCKQTVSQFIIAGLDPAIHAEVKRDRTLGSYLASRTSLWTTGSSPVATREIVAV